MEQVDIAIACGYSQHHDWWSHVMSYILSEVQDKQIRVGRILTSGSALPDQAKNKITGGWVQEKRRAELTDANRNTVMGVTVGGSVGPNGFFDSDSDWVMWIDDDTVPPKGFITHLLGLRREMVGGLYFLGGAPFNPIAYIKDGDGYYKPLWKYPHGALVPVDSIGMGCTLIHKSVYQKIMEAYEVFVRPTGSLIPILKSSIVADPYYNHPDRQVVNSLRYSSGEKFTLSVPLKKPYEYDNRPWPFYAMEYSRTEDHHFCELAKSVGVQPYLDTSVLCDHYKMKVVSRKDYIDYIERSEEGSLYESN